MGDRVQSHFSYVSGASTSDAAAADTFDAIGTAQEAGWKIGIGRDAADVAFPSAH